MFRHGDGATVSTWKGSFSGEKNAKHARSPGDIFYECKPTKLKTSKVWGGIESSFD
jgi:hypothetical protein